ncbi:MAG: FAD-dependent oxidoreductase [Armatimonadota bacterium]|nr:FAD-dependent oxidoreductase [bacterium]
MAKKIDYDLIILGAGPAGMTAGIYAARKQLDTLILTGDIGGQATWSADVENYLGYIYISGPELVRKFEEHLLKFPVDIEYTRAAKLSQINSGFRVDTEDGRVFTAKSVIVATGKSPRMLNVPGEKEYVAKGVTYCATCDGPLFAGKNVAVVGGGNSGLDAAVQLMKICPKVYIIEATERLRADAVLVDRVRASGNVDILTNTLVKSIHGNMLVDRITVENTSTGEVRDISVEGVFVEVGLAPNTDFIKDLLPLNEYGEVAVDCAGRTPIPGLYAAGDVTIDPEKQIIIAAGDGAKAALGAYSYLVRLPSATDWSTEATCET